MTSPEVPPSDLRLVLPAAAAWAAAAIALATDATVVAAAAALGALAACALLLALGRKDTHDRPDHPPPATGPPASGGNQRPHPSPPPAFEEEEEARRPTPRGAKATATAAAAMLLCATAAATTAALATAEAHGGPVPALAAHYREATLDVTVTGDPHATHSRPGTGADPTVVLEGEATRLVTGQRGTDVRTPVLLIARPSWLGLLPSTGIRVTGRLAPPARRGDRIAAVVRVTGPDPPHITERPNALQRMAARLRAGLRDATDGLTPDARALLPGLVVGDTSRIPPDLEDAFRATDLTHLLAVSGSNLAILIAVLIGPPHLAARAERRGLAARLGLPLRLTAVLGALLALGFVVVCRPEPSVLRAAGCGLITLLAIGTGRRRSLLPALAASVLLLVLWDPWLALSYGFLLSVLATGALLTLAPRWGDGLRRRGIPPRAAEALAAAAAAQAMCGPVIAVMAARVSLVAIPCNLLAELAVAPATVLGFAALVAAPLVPPAAEGLAWLAGWPASWAAAVARTGAGLPGAELGWPGGWPGGLLLAAVTGAAVFAARRTLHRPWACAACALLLLVAVVRPVPLTRVVTGWPPPDWRFAACDVGQGDALVLAAGEGTALVVDAGPEPRAVDRCLRALGVQQVPLLLLTHFHADHVDGLPGVLHGRAVGGIETTSFAEPPGRAAFVRREAERARVPVVEAVPGERRHLGELSWEVLWPPPAGVSVAAEDGPNDASVTLLVRSAGLTLLLLGDLEPPAQQALVETRPDLPPVDVLKVAHHGSAHQDPRLIRILRPRLAVVSVGAGNRYGHPSPRTVQALQAQGATVLRTDRDGPVAVTGDATAVLAK
ncbi:ComEC/Rec2 family competence protein [Streptomyces blastmyceticus]|uniref:ComEC/Rec2 family competence protein n=2 Tax=Streptomyces blastmyceticus TaxID=68180 RepID=A0ABN0W864_9ACTN